MPTIKKVTKKRSKSSRSPQREKEGTNKLSGKGQEESIPHRLSAKTEAVAIPPAILLYGVPGVGKTSFAAYFPKPIGLIDSQERGILVLKKTRQVPMDIPVFDPVETWEQAFEYLEELRTLEHDRQTLFVDSLTGFEKLCFLYHCRENFSTDDHPEGDWSSEGFLSYYRGPAAAAKTDWPVFIGALDKLRFERGMTIVLIAHAHTQQVDQPGKPPFEQFQPVLDKRILKVTDRWATDMLFMDYEIDFERKGKKQDPKNADRRYINTSYTGGYLAKNWHGLPPSISMGVSAEEAYENFKEKLEEKTNG
jgi:hypothetical protein